MLVAREGCDPASLLERSLHRLEGRLSGRVVEWQTRWLQVPVRESVWGFKSPLAHERSNERHARPHPDLSDGANRLRSWTDQVVPALVEAMKDREIPRWLPLIPEPHGPEEARKYITWAKGAMGEGERHPCGGD